jgi:hypothetical protein
MESSFRVCNATIGRTITAIGQSVARSPSCVLVYCCKTAFDVARLRGRRWNRGTLRSVRLQGD